MKIIAIAAAAILLAACQGNPTSKPVPLTAHWWTGDGDYHQVAANPSQPLEDVNHSLLVTLDGINLH